MITKQEILANLNSAKEQYQNNILRYNEKLDYLDAKSNDYKIYYTLRELDKILLSIVIHDIDYFNRKED